MIIFISFRWFFESHLNRTIIKQELILRITTPEQSENTKWKHFSDGILGPFFSINYVFNVCNNRICDCNGTKGCGDTFGTKCNSENNRKTGTFYCLRYILECLSLRTTKRNVITFFGRLFGFAESAYGKRCRESQ